MQDKTVAPAACVAKGLMEIRKRHVGAQEHCGLGTEVSSAGTWEGNGFPWGEWRIWPLTSFIPCHLLQCLRLSSFSVCPFLSLPSSRHVCGVALSLIYRVIHNPRDGPRSGACFSVGIFVWNNVHWINTISWFSGLHTGAVTRSVTSLPVRKMDSFHELIHIGCYKSNYYQIMK